MEMGPWKNRGAANGVLGDTLSHRRIACVEMYRDRTDVGSRRQLGCSANLPCVDRPGWCRDGDVPKPKTNSSH